MKYKVVIGLPAYNEEAVLDKLFEKIGTLGDVFGDALRLFVINDGSSDNTHHILQAYAEHLSYFSFVEHPQNKGLGRAMATMFTMVLDKFTDQDVLVTLDADNTHNPNIIPRMVEKLKHEQLDVVIASRFTPGGREIGLSLPRKVYSRGAKLFFKLFFPIPHVNDYSCGFRAYRIGYLRQAMALYDEQLITATGFACMAEILARFSKIGVRAGEYPLVLEYNLKEGKSKMHVLRTIGGYLRLLKTVKAPLREPVLMKSGELS